MSKDGIPPFDSRAKKNRSGNNKKPVIDLDASAGGHSTDNLAVKKRPARHAGRAMDAAQKPQVQDLFVASLVQELATTKEYMQAIIDAQEILNIELKVASEELQASNEKLQLINEKFESTKAELQATANLLATEMEKRVKVEESARRATFLAEAGNLLEVTLDYQMTLSHVISMIVPNFADWCAIDILEDNQSIHRLEAAHIDKSKQRLAYELQKKYPFNINADYGISKVLRTGQSALLSQISEVELLNIAADDDHLKILRELHPRSVMIVPLLARGRTLGIITFAISESIRFYNSTDLVFATDLAHRAALAVDNAWIYQRSQSSNSIKDEFFATISHELRTPLTAIIGWVKLLRMQKLDSDSFMLALDTIERNSFMQAKLVEDMLDISRIIAGKLRLEICEIDLVAAIQVAINTVRPAADAKSLKLNSILDARNEIILADPDRFQQIICNILSNAIKFTPAKGQIDIYLERSDSYIRLLVSDTGKGISAEFLPYVFDRFRQADSASIRLHSGLGLGLAIVRHLMELHGGTISADSNGEDKGATFTLQFPLMTAVEPTDTASNNYRRSAETSY